MSDCVEFSDCRECADKIYEWLDGEIDAASLLKVKAQLEYCRNCIGVYEFETALREMVKRNLHEDMPPRLKDRILEALKAADEGRK